MNQMVIGTSFYDFWMVSNLSKVNGAVIVNNMLPIFWHLDEFIVIQKLYEYEQVTIRLILIRQFYRVLLFSPIITG